MLAPVFNCTANQWMLGNIHNHEAAFLDLYEIDALIIEIDRLRKFERDHAEPAQPTGIEEMVCHDIAKRQQAGIKKYGKTVADNPLSLLAWQQHLYEELLDSSVYLKKIITQSTDG